MSQYIPVRKMHAKKYCNFWFDNQGAAKNSISWRPDTATFQLAMMLELSNRSNTDDDKYALARNI